MKQKYIRYILLVLLLIPAVFLIYGILSDHTGSVNTASNLEALMLTSGFPIIGLLLKKKWYFYYVYLASAFILFTIVIFGAYFFASEGLIASSVTVLYFGLILVLSIILHKSYSKEENALPPKPPINGPDRGASTNL